jgi:hypothetical protein
MQLRMSTQGVSERDRFALWHDTLFSKIGTVTQPLPDGAGTLRASFSGCSSGPLLNLKFQADDHPMVRRQGDVARVPWNSYLIFRECGAGMWCNRRVSGGRARRFTRLGPLVTVCTECDATLR